MNVQRFTDGKLRPAEFAIPSDVVRPRRTRIPFNDRLLGKWIDEAQSHLTGHAVFFTDIEPPVDFHGQRMTIVR